METDNIHAWCYPDLEQRWERKDYSWREVDERIYWDQCECVPPARMKAGAFAVGETWKHDENGQPIHAVFVEIDGRYFGRCDYLKSFNPEQYKAEIRQQYKLAA